MPEEVNGESGEEWKNKIVCGARLAKLIGIIRFKCSNATVFHIRYDFKEKEEEKIQKEGCCAR